MNICNLHSDVCNHHLLSRLLKNILLISYKYIYQLKFKSDKIVLSRSVYMISYIGYLRWRLYDGTHQLPFPKMRFTNDDNNMREYTQHLIVWIDTFPHTCCHNIAFGAEAATSSVLLLAHCDRICIVPDVWAALATAVSPSGFTKAWHATGENPIGMVTLLPRTESDVLKWPTGTIRLGRRRIFCR